MEVVSNNYMPGDPRLVQQLVYELKSQGIFDQFRKECISDVDTKPAYQNLRQRVEGSVTSFLQKQTWRPDVNKNQVRELLRKSIYESGYLDTGVERIVDQVVNPKINTIFLPQVEDVVYTYLGLEKPSRMDFKKELKIDVTDLLPTDLEAISPESDHTYKKDDSLDDSLNSDMKQDEDESPPFEPLDEQMKSLQHEENSVDSHLSGFSGLQSHDSNLGDTRECQMELSNQESQVSRNSSESRLSIVTSDENSKMEICDEPEAILTQNSNSETKLESSNGTNLEYLLKPAAEFKTIEQDEIHIKTLHENKPEDKKPEDKKPDDKKPTDKANEDSKEIEGKKNYDKKSEDKKYRERRSDDKKSRSSDKHSSKDKKDDKNRKSSSNSKDKSRSSSKYNSSSSSKDRDKSKDKRDSKSLSGSSKDKDGKDKNDKDKHEKGKNGKEKIVKDRNDNRVKPEKEKEKSDKDKDRMDKDKAKTSSSSSSKHSSSSSKDKDKSSSSLKKDSLSSSSSKNRDKDKEKSRSSSSNTLKDSKSKSSHSDSKSKSSSTDKHRKDDKNSHNGKHSSSSSSVKKDKNKKRNSKKDSKDDHYSSKDKKTDRRSTDRDSNDGQSGKQSQSSSFTDSSSSHQKNSQELSNLNSGSGSGDSGNSDQVETTMLMCPVVLSGSIENREIAITKYIKPKFASNFEEARKIMKIRKQLAKLERQNQMSMVQLEVQDKKVATQVPICNGISDEVTKEIDTTAVSIQEAVTELVMEEEDPKTPEKEVVPITESPVTPTLHSTELSKESWEALEARLAQEMSYINSNSYEVYDDYDYTGYNSIVISPQKSAPVNDVKNEEKDSTEESGRSTDIESEEKDKIAEQPNNSMNVKSEETGNPSEEVNSLKNIPPNLADTEKVSHEQPKFTEEIIESCLKEDNSVYLEEQKVIGSPDKVTSSESTPEIPESTPEEVKVGHSEDTTKSSQENNKKRSGCKKVRFQERKQRKLKVLVVKTQRGAKKLKLVKNRKQILDNKLVKENNQDFKDKLLQRGKQVLADKIANKLKEKSINDAVEAVVDVTSNDTKESIVEKHAPTAKVDLDCIVQNLSVKIEKLADTKDKHQGKICDNSLQSKEKMDVTENENQKQLKSETDELGYFCKYLEVNSPSVTRKFQIIQEFIKKLEKEVKQSPNASQNNSMPAKRGRKRKLDENVDVKNNNKAYYEQSTEPKKRKRSVAPNPNSMIPKANKEKVCNSTDISPNDSFSLPLSPAESDKSNDKKEEVSPKLVKQKQNNIGRSTRSQRYSSEDLYKPRLPIAATRRSRGAKNAKI